MLRHVRAALFLVGLLGGCSSLLGIDDWSPDDAAKTSTTGTGGAGAATGGGGSAVVGGGGSAAVGGSAAAGGAGGDETACTHELDCWWKPAAQEQNTTQCNPGPPTGTCVSSLWDFCGCNGDANVPAVFVELDANGDPTIITLIADPTSGPFNLGINNANCADAPEEDCPSSCASGLHLYRWTDLSQVLPADVHSLQLWREDMGSPCWMNDGGGVLFDLTGF